MEFASTESLDLGMASVGTGNATTTHNLWHAIVRLCTLDMTPDRDTDLATLNDNSATFTGYAQKQITWLAPSRATDGSIEVVGTVTEWRPSDDAEPNNIFVIYAVNVAGDLVFAGRVDDPPIPMQDNLDSLLLTIRWRPATALVGSTIS